ncbi:PilZ domain-containing protein [Methylobacterium sp. NEAU K]|uniref:PilZ domain-containing protein n=1 Tax=Methylobacterium sp. NEAU K TaxID=3064946 RepID=UPI002736A3E9|nr:PilZ domain-containing protein [Methylobacterium sp. NEAU K]MDP4004431.1 PilZ domain-containing protein [Methylobacterium sp. NEAU K]
MSRNTRPRLGFVERRAAERKATALLAFAHRPDGSRLPCRIQNLSDRGAMLEFLSPDRVMLEDSFDLVLANSDMRYAVKLIWRKDRTAGVLFCL